MSHAAAHCSRIACTVPRRMTPRDCTSAGPEMSSSRCSERRPVLSFSSLPRWPAIWESRLTRMPC
eukprot:4170499-Heterocapsa_arctica.AAC.1